MQVVVRLKTLLADVKALFLHRTKSLTNLTGNKEVLLCYHVTGLYRRFLESIRRKLLHNYCNRSKEFDYFEAMWSDDDDCYLYSPHYFGSEMDDSDVDEYYFDEDDYCGYSSGETECLRKLAARRHHDHDEDSDDSSISENTSSTTYQILSLQDLCCRYIALKFPFAYVEHRSPPIPDELQLKIIGFSFPEDEQMIMKYAQFSRSGVDFSSAKSMRDNGSVKNLSQIGRCDSKTMGLLIEIN